jgi:pimeloyl-ACP methyl ester carboxylesterase
MTDLLLLHGALGAMSQFAEPEKILKTDFRIHLLNFTGHGGEPLPAESFSIKLFADDVLSYIDKNRIEKADIFGYSMGGYVAVYLAKHFSERIGKVFTLGTKFRWDTETAGREIKMLDPVRMQEKIPQFYAELQKRHLPESLEVILKKTGEMMMNLGRVNELKPSDFAAIQNEILVALGDRDKMVTLGETVEVFKKIPRGSLLVLPNTPHPLESVDFERLADEIRRFFIKRE